MGELGLLSSRHSRELPLASPDCSLPTIRMLACPLLIIFGLGAERRRSGAWTSPLSEATGGAFLTHARSGATIVIAGARLAKGRPAWELFEAKRRRGAWRPGHCAAVGDPNPA